MYSSEKATVFQVSKGMDSADFALISRAKKGDVVVTGDYGVATMALAKGCHACNFNGKRYTEENIDQLLFERHLSKKMRKAGVRTSNARKRTKEDDEKFKDQFKKLLEICALDGGRTI